MVSRTKAGQIVSAFAFQAVASWVLSVILEVVLADPLNHGSLHATRPVRRGLSSVTLLCSEFEKFEKDLVHMVEENVRHVRQLSKILFTLREDGRRQLHNLAAKSRSQNVPQTLVEENIHEGSPRQEARKVVAEILYFSSDVQTLAGEYLIESPESRVVLRSLGQVLL